MRPCIITVFGSSQSPPGSACYELAFELGQAIARAVWQLCNGGYGGTMEAAALGAASAGGHTIGVTCRVFRRDGPNAHIRQEIPTFDLWQRLNTLMRLGSGYVVLPGGSGTLLELAAVWEFTSKSLLKPRRPIVLLGGSWAGVVECILREQARPENVHEALRVPEACDLLRENMRERERPMLAK